MSSPVLPPAAAHAAGSDDDLVGSSAAGPAALRGSALLGGGYAAAIALSLVSSPLLIRHLGIADFGRYTTVVAIVTIVSGLTDAGLVNIALREWATREGEDRARLMRSLLGVRLELSAAGVAIGVVFAVLAGYDSTLVLGTLIAGVGMVLTALANLFTIPLQGDLRFGWVSIINISRQVITVALIVALVLVGAGLLALLAVTIPAGIVTLFLTAMVVRGRIPLCPRLHDTQWWPLVRDTLPYGAAIAVNALYFRVTIIVMSLIAPPRQTGYFATSFRVIEVLIGVPALAIGTAFPILSRAARDDRQRFAYATERVIELALVVGTSVVLVVVLSAPFVIDVLAGAAGGPAAGVLQIQGLALVASFVTTALGFVLLALRRHTVLLIANGGALLANIVLTLVLVPISQARGAAIAAVASETCLSFGLLAVLLSTRTARVRLASIPAVVVAGLAGASPLLVAGVHPLLRMLAGLAIYGALITLFGRLPPEVRHALQRVRPNSSVS
jgi:O-antigen/teichoic acid export membrane protein